MKAILLAATALALLPQLTLADGAPKKAKGGTWTALKNQCPTSAAAEILMTDGTVLVNNTNAAGWWRLTPDKTGSYVNGTWTQIASMPSGYTPLYFASAVLPNGQLITNGGEYNGGGGVWTTKGAIYDPVQNTWTSVTPPKGWTTIGDAQSVVLPDGTYMLANCCTTQQATLDLNSMTWTATGTGKADINDEEGWTLLPNGSVLTVDANNTGDLDHTELYTGGTWASAGDTPEELPDLTANGGGSHELGPAVLMPNGTVFAAGATGHNAIYTLSTKTWSEAPDFPVIAGGQYDIADGPASLEPSGSVLMAASPGVFNNPVQMFEWNGTTLAQTTNFPAASNDTSYQVHLLPLPNGQIMETDFSNDVEIYTPTGKAVKGASVPKIKSIASTLTHGQSYTLKGVGLNGQSQGGAYGDDYQNATNWPLVRITNTASGDVFYAKTSNFSSMGVAVAGDVTATVLIPTGIETGPSTLVAVANGIPSKPVNVTIN